MKSILELTNREVIHTPTEKEAITLLKIFHHLGQTWSTGSSYLNHSYWENHKKDTVYRPKTRHFGSLTVHKEKGDTIYTVSEIKEYVEYTTKTSKQSDKHNDINKAKYVVITKEGYNYIPSKETYEVLKIKRTKKAVIYAIGINKDVWELSTQDYSESKEPPYELFTTKDMAQIYAKQRKPTTMKSIQELTSNEGIHADTEIEANILMTLFNSLGLVWNTGIPYTTKNNWHIHQSKTVYIPATGAFNAVSSKNNKKRHLYLPRQIKEYAAYVKAMQDTPYKVDEIVVLLDIGSSIHTSYKIRKLLPYITKIIKIDDREGQATKQDPRYYGENWDARAKGLRKVTPEELSTYRREEFKYSHEKHGNAFPTETPKDIKIYHVPQEEKPQLIEVEVQPVTILTKPEEHNPRIL